MKGRSAEMMKGRVPVNDLIRFARNTPKERPSDPDKEIVNKARETGERIRACTVHGFYEAFLHSNVSNENDFESEQAWIDDCIGAMLEGKAVSGMTMGDIATGIAEKMGRDDLSDEDRWALYELCFFLTAKMARLDGKFFAHRQQCTRLGTPDEKELHSLYNRVAYNRITARSGAGDTRPKVRVSVDDLLRSVGRGTHVLSERTRLSIPDLKVGPVIDCLMISKYGLDPEDKHDKLDLYEKTFRFAEMFNMYSGQEWSVSRSLTDIATMMTWVFWLKVKDADDEGVERARVLQAYELCYEFINLLASPEYDGGHVSLMVREGLDSSYDVDESVKSDIFNMMGATE